MRKNKRNIHKAISGAERKSKIEQGFFDGRFITRVIPSKKNYKRKPKHQLLTKNQNYEN